MLEYELHNTCGYSYVGSGNLYQLTWYEIFNLIDGGRFAKEESKSAQSRSKLESEGKGWLSDRFDNWLEEKGLD